METLTQKRSKKIDPSELLAEVKDLKKQLSDCLNQNLPKPEPKERPLKPLTAQEQKALDKLVIDSLSNPTARIQPKTKTFAVWVSDREIAKALTAKVKSISSKKMALKYFGLSLEIEARKRFDLIKEVKETNTKKYDSIFNDPYLIALESQIFYSRLQVEGVRMQLK